MSDFQYRNILNRFLYLQSYEVDNLTVEYPPLIPNKMLKKQVLLMLLLVTYSSFLKSFSSSIRSSHRNVIFQNVLLSSNEIFSTGIFANANSHHFIIVLKSFNVNSTIQKGIKGYLNSFVFY
jgi:hypothetical protein